MTKNATKQDSDFSKKSNLVEPFTLASCLLIACFVYLNHQALFFPWFKLSSAASSPASDVDQRLECDVYDGRWGWDDNYPPYHSEHCPFIDNGFRCSKNGRPDSFYTKWRWQPKACNLPRFNATKMLEKLRNRRIAFVGDSIGRNQWESMLCMLSSAIPNKDSMHEVNGSPITKHKGFLVFRFADYNFTVEYYRAPFLVAQGSAPRGAPKAVKMTLRLDLMDRTWRRWVDADVLVFNTGHWWSHDKTTNRGCYFQQGMEMNLNMDITAAFRKSIETLLDFIHGQVNTSKTQVYFRTYAPQHFRGGSWSNGGHCHHIKLPDFGSYPD
ncbi:protein trichome birefringence-like 10 [Hibiscus syriacus]|uniref:protein trichome birefringence-like 10 n=1 Tax=Hibiscus syriacus TaxID=106335 RepID=UPI001924D411|nr:protein trichome birefringence-like 10 [Hibiscus syriacus]